MPSNKFIAYIMWGFASIFYAYQYILRVMPSVLIDDIMSKYEIDPTLFGQMSGIYYIGYSLIHIPVGILLDRFGPKRIMPIFMLLTVVGLLPLVVTELWVYPLLGRCLVGLGSSSAILGLFKIIRMTFEQRKFNLMLSLSVTIGLMGAIYGGAPLYYMREFFGFEEVVIFLMITGILLGILMFIILPAQSKAPTDINIFQNIRQVLTNKMVLSICILAGLMVGPLEGFADVWGVRFLTTVYGLEEGVASGLPSIMFLGMCFGGPLLSLIVSKTKNDIAVIASCAVLMGVAFIILLSTTLSITSLSIIFFITGILCAYQIIAISHTTTYVPQMAGLISAVANMIIMMFGYVFHSAIGSCIDYFSADGISKKALIYGISIIPIALFISALGFLFILRRRALFGKFS